MRRVLRKCRNFLYQSVIKRMWKDHAFRFFIVEAIKHSNEYDLRIVSAQIASMSDGEQDFFRFIINHFTTSHSQSVQDLWALYEAKEARNKFFVEFGATDGVKINNTVLLEREYGWKGILAEPNPIWHEALFKNRSAAIETRCVHSATGHTLEFFNADVPEFGGVIRKGTNGAAKKLGMRGQLIKVETISLNDLLENHHSPEKIDFMSIDTEGSEYEILAAFDLAKWKVGLLTIEMGSPEKNAAIDHLLKKYGYIRRFERFSGGDAWYKRVE